MILVDTSVWIDHLRAGDPDLVRALEASLVLGHPAVTGELALGGLGNRAEILGLIQALPRASVATDDEVLGLIEVDELAGSGIGYVDVHLLAATKLTADARLWTRDRRLAATADRLGLGLGPGGVAW